MIIQKYTIIINLGANDYIEIDQAAEPPISNRFEVIIIIYIIYKFIGLKNREKNIT